MNVLDVKSFRRIRHPFEYHTLAFWFTPIDLTLKNQQSYTEHTHRGKYQSKHLSKKNTVWKRLTLSYCYCKVFHGQQCWLNIISDDSIRKLCIQSNMRAECVNLTKSYIFTNMYNTIKRYQRQPVIAILRGGKMTKQHYYSWAPRGNNLFKIILPYWALTFWVILRIIIMVGDPTIPNVFNWAQNTSRSSFGALGTLNYVIV